MYTRHPSQPGPPGLALSSRTDLHSGDDAGAEHHLQPADVALGAVADEHLVGSDETVVELLRDLLADVGLRSERRRCVGCVAIGVSWVSVVAVIRKIRNKLAFVTG